MRTLVCLAMVHLVGCSSVLGIEDPRPAGDGGLPEDGMPMQRCTPVINELKTGATSSSADEWIELYNGCGDQVDVTDWILVYRSANAIGSTDSTVLVTLQGAMAPRSFRLYVGGAYTGTNDGTWTSPNLPNGQIGQSNGAVGLRDDKRVLVDSLAYGQVTAGHPFIETKEIGAMANDLSASRRLDGSDTNNNSVDFEIIAAGTPGTSNGL